MVVCEGTSVKKDATMVNECMYGRMLLYCRPYAFVDENPCFISQLLQLRSTDRLVFNVVTLLLLVLITHMYSYQR